MNLAQKIQRVADAVKGKRGQYQVNIIHKEGCPARSSGNIIQCCCDFIVRVTRNKNTEKKN